MKRVVLIALGGAVVLSLLAFDPVMLPFLFDLDLLVGLASAGFFMTRVWIRDLVPIRARSGASRTPR